MRRSDWKARGYKLETGYAYVGGAFIRDIREAVDGRVRYTDYGVHDGASIGEGNCRADTFILWASREATEEEVERLHTSDFEIESNRRLGEQLMAAGREYACFLLSDPEVITDEMLNAEVQRRGIGRKEMTNGNNERDETLGRYLAAAFIAHRLGISLDRAYKQYTKDAANMHPSWYELGDALQQRHTQNLDELYGPAFDKRPR